MPAAAAAALRAVPGVGTVTEVLNTTIWVGKDKRSAQGLTPTGVREVLDPDVTAGSLDHFGQGTIAMSDTAAQGRHIGDAVAVTLGDGVKAQFRLVAIYARGLGFGDTLLAHDDVVGHVDDPLAKVVLIRSAVSDDQLRAPLDPFPGLSLRDRSGYEQIRAAERQTNGDVDLVLMGLVIGFTAIAVINTLAVATGDRSRELALMRLVGTTRRQVLRTLRCELGLAVLVAAALGTAAAWLTLSSFSAGIVGSRTPTVVPWIYGLVVAGAIALGLIGTELPARMVLRRNPAEEVSGPR